MSKTTQKEIERLYGRMQGWEEARTLIQSLAGDKFLEGKDDSASLLRNLTNGVLKDQCLMAEDAWREADPNAIPRKK